MKELNKFNIGTQVLYIPIFLHPYYKKKYNFKIKNFPNSNEYYEKASLNKQNLIEAIAISSFDISSQEIESRFVNFNVSFILVLRYIKVFIKRLIFRAN